MRPFPTALVTILALICWIPAAFCEDKATFEKRLFGITPLSHFSVDTQRFRTLNQNDKTNLLAARTVLSTVLERLEKKQDALPYLTREFAKNFKSSTELAASLISPETSLMALGITDFELVDSSSTKLQFFVLTFSEGNLVVSEKTASLKKTSAGWRIDKFD
jgi:hypothetical protein